MSIQSSAPPLIPLHLFGKQIGVSSVTLWRWRKRGWLKAVVINRRPYLAQEEIQRFLTKASNGELSGIPIPTKLAQQQAIGVRFWAMEASTFNP